MTARFRETLAIETDPDLFDTLRRIAQTEGLTLQALVDEALDDLVEKRAPTRPRARVMELYRSSHEAWGPLYRRLAE